MPQAWCVSQHRTCTYAVCAACVLAARQAALTCPRCAAHAQPKASVVTQEGSVGYSCLQSIGLPALKHNCTWAYPVWAGTCSSGQAAALSRRLSNPAEPCGCPQVRPSLVLLDALPPGAGGVTGRLATAPAAAALSGLSTVSCSLSR